MPAKAEKTPKKGIEKKPAAKAAARSEAAKKGAATKVKDKAPAAKPSKTKYKIYYKGFHEERGRQVENFFGCEKVVYAESKREAQEKFLELAGKMKVRIYDIELAASNSKIDTKAI